MLQVDACINATISDDREVEQELLTIHYEPLEALAPGVQVLRSYQLAWFAGDLMAGLVLTTMLVPVGIAYALASGVPGIYGLYATIVPLLAYALFGPSRILVLGRIRLSPP
jgi:MFS superfamily sulfate permease-like transporter